MILLAPLVLWGQDTVKQILYDLLHALYQPMSESRFGGAPPKMVWNLRFAIKVEVRNQDSGYAIQWMNASSRVVPNKFHSEKFSQKSGDLEMFQLWISLSSKFKMTRLRYRSFEKGIFQNSIRAIISVT